jgi:hypothetical protein
MAKCPSSAYNGLRDSNSGGAFFKAMRVLGHAVWRWDRGQKGDTHQLLPFCWVVFTSADPPPMRTQPSTPPTHSFTALHPLLSPPLPKAPVQLYPHANQRQHNLENGLQIGHRPVGPGVPGPAPEGLVTPCGPAAACACCTAPAAAFGRLAGAAAEGPPHVALQISQ